MKRVRIIVVAVMTLMAGVLLPGVGSAPEAAAFDVYTTPGTHTVNGRQWRTSCAPYSSNIERCRTEILATQIQRDSAGRFSQTNGWAFNNLTYKPVDRAWWGSNPLARTGSWTENGRQWRTECDTPATGRNGCRSYIYGTVYTVSGGRYTQVNQWMFNNIVRFTPGSSSAPITYPTAPPMSSAPAFLQGRRHFTLGTLVTQSNTGSQARGIGRLSNIELDPGGRVGTFTERYWAYTFDMAAAETDFGQFRASIPRRPTGCASSGKETADRTAFGLPALPSGTCDVRTARSFLANPTVRTGTYEAIGGHSIKLYWRGTAVTETYRNVTPQGQAHSELRLTSHGHPNAVNAIGFLFGSTKARGAGRSLVPEISRAPWQPPRSVNPSVVSQSLFPYNAGGADKTLWTQSVGSPNLLASRQAFQFEHYVPAGNDCITTPAGTKARVENGWHSYMCPLPSEGKMVWHHMAASLVAEAHGLCPAYVPGQSWESHMARCRAASPRAANYSLPARPGGHVYEALQVIDDNNNLAGIVGLESSLYSHKRSSLSQLGLFAAVAPPR